MAISHINKEIAFTAAIFQGLQQDELIFSINCAQIVSKTDGAFFFMEDEPATSSFILLQGKVKLFQITPSGQQVILGYLVPGRTYGIISALKKVTYPVSAQAVGDSIALSFSHQVINQLMEKFPRIALNALKIMAAQIRDFQNTVRDLSTQRVEQRVARAVLKLLDQSGIKQKKGILIDLPLSRQDLAEMTGTTLFTVSRILKEWENRDIIHSQRQKIFVVNQTGLIQIANDMVWGDIPPSTVEKCDL